MIHRFKNLSEQELDTKIMRYFKFYKFEYFINYKALWFPKLGGFQDKYEGTLPSATQQAIVGYHQQLKSMYPESYHRGIDEMATRNVEDGRNLIVVNCWTIANQECQRMWNEYVGNNEGVVVTSTIKKLSQSLMAEPSYTYMGKVQYVDMKSFRMTDYHATQAYERAFLKDHEQFHHESELRITSMNFKTLGTVAMNGRSHTHQECSGANMNNHLSPGLYIGTNLSDLINDLILAPNATKDFSEKIQLLVSRSGLHKTLKRSSLDS